MLLAGTLASCIFVSGARAQGDAPVNQPAGTQTTSPAAAAARQPYRPAHFSHRAGLYYEMVWGVDSLSVRWAEQGEVIRFSYRVLDASRAKTLNDKSLEPSLIDPAARVKLVIPELEKVGKLRQTSTPESGRAYWMAFSNKGRKVKRGDRVNVVIGQFQANGLVVE